MLKELKILRHHGSQYVRDLRNQPVTELFRGRPVISDSLSSSEITRICSLCPAGAISESDGAIDLGKCVFCRECESCLPGKIRFTNDYRLVVNRREDLVIKPGSDVPVRLDEKMIRKEVRKLFRKSLKLRQVSAGGEQFLRNGAQCRRERQF